MSLYENNILGANPDNVEHAETGSSFDANIARCIEQSFRLVLGARPALTVHGVVDTVYIRTSAPPVIPSILPATTRRLFWIAASSKTPVSRSSSPTRIPLAS